MNFGSSHLICVLTSKSADHVTTIFLSESPFAPRPGVDIESILSWWELDSAGGDEGLRFRIGLAIEVEQLLIALVRSVADGDLLTRLHPRDVGRQQRHSLWGASLRSQNIILWIYTEVLVKMLSMMEERG